MKTVLDAVKERFSTRGFTEQPLSDAELEKILNAGLQAPTAANRQELHFTVLKGTDPVLEELEEEKNRLRGIKRGEHIFYYEAPTVIVISSEEAFHWGSLDAGIAVENMVLAAESLGLGTLIIGCIFDAMRGEKAAEYAKKLQFPEGYRFEIALAIGHTAVAKEPHTYDASRQITRL
jgi:nitroreductase